MRICLLVASFFTFPGFAAQRLGAVNPFDDKPVLVSSVVTNRVYSHFSIPLNSYAAGISLPVDECREVEDALLEAVPDLVAKAKTPDVASDPIRWWPLGIGTTLNGSYFGFVGDSASRKFRMILKESPSGQNYAGWEEVEAGTPLFIAVFNNKLGYRHNGTHWELLDRTQDPFTLELSVTQQRKPHRLYNHFDRQLKGWTWRLSGPDGTLTEWILDAGTTLSGDFLGLEPSLTFSLLKKEDLKNKTDYLDWCQVDSEAKSLVRAWSDASWYEWNPGATKWAPITGERLEEYNPVTGQTRLVELPEPDRIYFRALKTWGLTLWGYSFATAERKLQPWVLSDGTTVKGSYFGLSTQSRFKLVRNWKGSLTWTKAATDDPVVLVSTNWNEVDGKVQLADQSWTSLDKLNGPKYIEAKKAARALQTAINRWHARKYQDIRSWADGLTAWDRPGNSPFAGGGGIWVQGDEYAKENANPDPWSRPGFMPFAGGGWYLKQEDSNLEGGSSPFSRPRRP